MLDSISNIEPFKIKDFFTKEEFEYIYSEADNAKNSSDYLCLVGGDKIVKYFLKNKNPLVESISKKMTEALGEDIIAFPGFYARYTVIDNIQPRLYPHHDTSSMENHTFTMSVQLKSSIDWDIAVNETTYSLSENEAVIFCGTGQLHYRPDPEFMHDDFYDIFVCHFIPKRFREMLDDDHQEVMKNKAQMLYNKIYDK